MTTLDVAIPRLVEEFGLSVRVHRHPLRYVFVRRRFVVVKEVFRIVPEGSSGVVLAFPSGREVQTWLKRVHGVLSKSLGRRVELFVSVPGQELLRL